MDKKNIRVFFEKKGRAVYISHLDLLRTMQRALKRSGLPVWYSEGFNPRIYLNFPLALALGSEGEREAMDFAVIEDISPEEAAKRLDAVCPEGIRIISAAYPVHLNKEIGFAEHSLIFKGESAPLKAALDSFLARESITVLKRSKKKGMVETDIKPHITLLAAVPLDDGLKADIRLPAGNELNINAAVFSDAFLAWCAENSVSCKLMCTKRTNILCADGAEFA